MDSQRLHGDGLGHGDPRGYRTGLAAWVLQWTTRTATVWAIAAPISPKADYRIGEVAGEGGSVYAAVTAL